MAAARQLEEIGRRMDALGLWEAIAPYNWAVRPRGVAVPYFCTLMGDESRQMKVHFMMLDGWQTFHDYLRTRADNSFGFYSTPCELPHYDLAVRTDGAVRVLRHDPGYVPRDLAPTESALCARILWEAYGVMMRIESDPSVVMRFAEESAVFARVEGADGVWRDEPMPIVRPRPHIERISFRKSEVARAKDLPFVREEALELDMRLAPGMRTSEARPRSAYRLVALEAKTGERVLFTHLSIDPETGLRGIWEGMSARLLGAFLTHGRVPGEVKVVSGRMFRMLRPLCGELPFKLSLHDSLPALEAAMRT